MDGSIDLTVQVFVQRESSKLTLRSEETPGLFFIGGKQLIIIYVFYVITNLQNGKVDVKLLYHLVYHSFSHTCQALTTLDSGLQFLGFLQILSLVYQHNFPVL